MDVLEDGHIDFAPSIMPDSCPGRRSGWSSRRPRCAGGRRVRPSASYGGTFGRPGSDPPPNSAVSEIKGPGWSSGSDPGMARYSKCPCPPLQPQARLWPQDNQHKREVPGQRPADLAMRPAIAGDRAGIRNVSGDVSAIAVLERSHPVVPGETQPPPQQRVRKLCQSGNPRCLLRRQPSDRPRSSQELGNRCFANCSHLAG